MNFIIFISFALIRYKSVQKYDSLAWEAVLSENKVVVHVRDFSALAHLHDISHCLMLAGGISGFEI